jgi:hypothetical protein
MNRYKGIFRNPVGGQPKFETMDSLTSGDGTSNTLMFGESIGSSFGSQRDVGFPWIATGFMPGFGLLPSDRATVKWDDWSSNHAGLVNFAVADGSVRPLRTTGRDATSQGPHNPPTAAERAFMAMTGFLDGDATTADGITQ